MTGISGFIEKNFKYFVVIILFITAFNIFFKIGELRVDWDEARHGVSAYEMMQSGNYLVNTYVGQTDYWNTKPPLGFWFVAASFKIFGPGIFSLKFHSALFTVLTSALLMLFTAKYFSRSAAIWAGAVYAVCFYFQEYNGATVGDFDAVLVFLLFLSVFFMAEFERRSKKYLFYLTGLCFGLAFFLKTFAVIQIFPVFLIYFLANKIYKKISWKDCLVFLLCCAGPFSIWAFWRLNYDGPRFFQNMFFYDFIERTTIDLHKYYPQKFIYFTVLYNRFSSWFFVLLMAAIIAGKEELQSIFNNKYFQLIILAIIFPVVMFCLSASKFPRYIITVLPFCAVFCGVIISLAFNNKRETASKLFPVIMCLAVLTVFIKYEMQVFAETDNLLISKHLHQQYILDHIVPRSRVYVDDDLGHVNIFLIKAAKQAEMIRIESIDKFLNDKADNTIMLFSSDYKMLPKETTDKVNILFYGSGWYFLERKKNLQN